MISRFHRTINKNSRNYALLWIFIGVFSRIIPHPLNATATISLALWAPLFFNRSLGLMIALLSLAISDFCLHVFAHDPLFGSWSLFTYSATAALVLLNQSRGHFMGLITVCGSLGFWIWTNFGTWLLTSDLYPKSAQGLVTCFAAGLPFLKNSLIASLAYSLTLGWIHHHESLTKNHRLKNL